MCIEYLIAQIFDCCINLEWHHQAKYLGRYVVKSRRASLGLG